MYNAHCILRILRFLHSNYTLYITQLSQIQIACVSEVTVRSEKAMSSLDQAGTLGIHNQIELAKLESSIYGTQEIYR